MHTTFFHEIIDCLVEALEAKDTYTKGHSTRVADMCCDMARALEVSKETYELIHFSAHVHDIGKMGIPDQILNKEGRLEDHEWLKIKEHPVIGATILERSSHLKAMAKVVLHHHERFDGTGYPDGIAGDRIPFASRVIAICDCIDAMTTKRSYRKALSWQTCREELIKNSGIQFDPELVPVALNLLEVWEERYAMDSDLTRLKRVI